MSEPKWVGWAREIQAIAQTGLHFSENAYDRERYRQLQDLAAEIFAEHSDADATTIQAIFGRQTGYATPKVDVRGVVFQDDRILLVREQVDGLWTLPGGWADVNDAPSEAVEREIREESGYEAKAERLLAVFDRAKHAHVPPFPFSVYKLFLLCRLTGGKAETSHETTAVGFFAENELPPLSIGRVTREQIQLCFAERGNLHAPARFD